MKVKSSRVHAGWAEALLSAQELSTLAAPKATMHDVSVWPPLTAPEAPSPPPWLFLVLRAVTPLLESLPRPHSRGVPLPNCVCHPLSPSHASQGRWRHRRLLLHNYADSLALKQRTHSETCQPTTAGDESGVPVDILLHGRG